MPEDKRPRLFRHAVPDSIRVGRWMVNPEEPGGGREAEFVGRAGN